jgi:hypothetical protein
MVWQCILVGMAIGVIAELVARILHVWIFRHWSLALLNIVLLYGVVMGGLASLIRPLGVVGVFGTAVLIGSIGELANLQFLHFWKFPDGRSDGSGARAAMIVVISLLWGAVPLMVSEVQRGLRQASVRATMQDPVEYLDARERTLLEKQEGLQQRLHEIESRLQALRTRRERELYKSRPRQTHPAHRDGREG